MIKNVSVLEHKIGDKVFQFYCEPSSSIGEVKEALFQFMKYCGQIEDNARSQAQASKPDISEPKKEE